jgi:O-antigen ligase
VAGAVFLARPELLLWRWQHSGGLLEGRLDYWLATLQMIAEKPLLGWGLGTWPDVYLQFMQQDPGLAVNRAHSDFLEFAAEGGVLLPLALAGLLLRTVWLAFRFPWALGLPVLLAFAMADYPLRLPLLLWTFLALYLAAESEMCPIQPGLASRAPCYKPRSPERVGSA